MNEHWARLYPVIIKAWKEKYDIHLESIFVRFYARYWEYRGNKNRPCLLGDQRKPAQEMCHALPTVCLWVKVCTHSLYTLQAVSPWDSHTHYPGNPEEQGVLPFVASLLPASLHVNKRPGACVFPQST